MADMTLQAILRAQDAGFDATMKKGEERIRSFGAAAKTVDSPLAGMELRLRSARMATGQFTDTWRESLGMASRAGMVIAGAGAAIVGGLFAAAKSAIDFGSSIHDMSARTGVGSKTLTALQYAAEQTGASMGSVERGMKLMSKAAYAAQDANSEQAQSFNTLGVSVVDAHGKLKPTEKLFVEVGEALRKVENSTARAALASKILGRGGTELIPMFTDAKQSIGDFIEEAKRLGLTLDDETTAKLDDAGDAMDRFKTQARMAFMQLGVAATPALKDLTDWLSKGAASLRAFTAEHPSLVKMGVGLAGAFGGISVVVGPLLMAMPGLLSAYQMLQVWRGRGLAQLPAEAAATEARVGLLTAEAGAAERAALAQRGLTGARAGGAGAAGAGGAGAAGAGIGGGVIAGAAAFGIFGLVGEYQRQRKMGQEAVPAYLQALLRMGTGPGALWTGATHLGRAAARAGWVGKGAQEEMQYVDWQEAQRGLKASADQQARAAQDQTQAARKQSGAAQNQGEAAQQGTASAEDLTAASDTQIKAATTGADKLTDAADALTKAAGTQETAAGMLGSGLSDTLMSILTPALEWASGEKAGGGAAPAAAPQPFTVPGRGGNAPPGWTKQTLGGRGGEPEYTLYAPPADTSAADAQRVEQKRLSGDWREKAADTRAARVAASQAFFADAPAMIFAPSKPIPEVPALFPPEWHGPRGRFEGAGRQAGTMPPAIPEPKYETGTPGYEWGFDPQTGSWQPQKFRRRSFEGQGPRFESETETPLGGLPPILTGPALEPRKFHRRSFEGQGPRFESETMQQLPGPPINITQHFHGPTNAKEVEEATQRVVERVVADRERRTRYDLQPAIA